jgi:hypothetical protein
MVNRNGRVASLRAWRRHSRSPWRRPLSEYIEASFRTRRIPLSLTTNRVAGLIPAGTQRTLLSPL